MSILCSLRNINLNFGERPIFNGAELIINKNDHIGLIGLNGQGKSTLFKILMNQVIPDISTPSFIFDKNNELFTPFLIPQELDLTKFKELNLSEYYLSFYPELYELSRKLKKIEELIISNYSEQLIVDQEKILDQFDRLSGWEIERNYLSYLKSFGLDDLNRNIESLSGGERKKVALSIGLSTPAEFILWDEPTNHLDVESIERFEDEIKKMKKTYMIISHDRYLLNHLTNRMIHIERGDITSFQGTYIDYLNYQEERQKELAKHLDKAQNKQRRELAWMRQGIKARGTRSKKRVEGFHGINNEIQRLKDLKKKEIQIELSHSNRKSKKLVEFKDVNFSYDEKIIFDSISLSIYKKQKIALIGPNGAGKTTLIKLLSGRINATSGEVKSLDSLKVAYFEQHREALIDEMTPHEFVGEGSEFITLPNGHKKHIISYLESFLFESNQIKRPISTLSGGEKNRLQLAKFLKNEADLFIFDEPTNDLDLETIEILEQSLVKYEAAVIIISHDRAFLDAVCQVTWLIDEKQIEVFTGGYTQVADYLQVLNMKNRLPKQVTKNEEVKKTDKKISNKDKMDWKIIESQLEEVETDLGKYKDLVEKFDFSSMDESKKIEFDKLNKLKSEKEKNLEELYARWEYLSEIFN